MEKKETAKKRGRPKKEKVEPEYKNTNEEAHSIQMAAEEKITYEYINNKWSGVVDRYKGTQLTFDTAQKAYSWAIQNNPFLQNQRVKGNNSMASKSSKEGIQKMLENPGNSEHELQRVGAYLYYTNFVYNNLLRLEREIPCYYSYILPQYLDKEDMEKKSFKEEMRFANKILDAFNPQLSFKTINTQVQMEGKCSYLVRKSYKYPEKVNFFLLEKLMPEQIKITGIGSKQQYTVSFNMVIFLNPVYDVNKFPPYIREIWNEMIDGGMIQTDSKTGNQFFNPTKPLSSNHVLEYVDNSYFYWVDLHQDDCFTFGQDLATPMCFPQTMGLFLDLKELDDYRWLMGSLMSKGVTSILTAEVPITKDAKAGSNSTIITPELIQFFDSMFSNTVSSNVATYFGPFSNFKLQSLDNQPDNMNIVYNRLRDLVATSGNAALLSINEKPSISMTKTTQAIGASRANYLTLQFQQFLNNVINNQFELKYQYKTTLWGDIFDVNGELKMAKEMLQNGVTSMLPRVMSAYGQSIEDVKTINDYIEISGINIYAREEKTETENNSVGRPPVDEKDLENDSTADAKDGGDNVSDIKI